MRTLSLLIFLVLSGNVWASAVFTSGVVPHRSQWDNPPSGVWACGHAALRSAALYVTGIDKSLASLHSTMFNNTATYRSKLCGSEYCARLLDLDYAVRLSQNNGYGRPLSYRNDTVTTYQKFLDKVKDGMTYNYPPVAESGWKYSMGHFYVIVGYEEKGSAASSLVYLRDVNLQAPAHTKYDTVTTVRNFHNK
jgi:hypothetical protein